MKVVIMATIHFEVGKTVNRDQLTVTGDLALSVDINPLAHQQGEPPTVLPTHSASIL